MPKFLVTILLALGLPASAVSQTTQPACSAGDNSAPQSTAIARTGFGTPYTLTAIIKSERKLYDGNAISGFTTSHQARDSQGRTRVETPSVCGMDKDRQPHWQGSITVTDPVANSYTFWQDWLVSSPKIASVTHTPTVKYPTPPTEQEEYRSVRQMSRNSDHAGPHDVVYTAEDLGKRNLAGVEASGMRVTRTVPPGMYGNALPLKYVEEKWVSDAYGVILLDINDDPVAGKSTYEVTSFTRGEPDASLFQPPAGYTINDRTASQ